ncbi:MAG: cyclic nucleotide-binding domain-containing protein [Gammaproteobacteria bacterium]|nr:cyclic nucleotide-binding domain-containing protein [Gammaproteobacteria bacterium]MCP4980330.1 cyclic nucleotide-binding domain-containing protein [Gammaproteobacteria bacterium]
MDDFEILRNHSPLLASLDDETINTLVDQTEQVEFAPGELVMGRGELADRAYLVLEGDLAVLIDRDWGEARILEKVGVGDLAGELELLSGERRLAEIRALEPCRLLSLSPEILGSLIESHPNVWQFIADTSKTKICRLLLSRHLSELFGTANTKMSDPLAQLEAENQWLNFEHEILRQIEEKVDWVTLNRGDFLFHQGDRAEGAYVLVSGILQVRIRDENDREWVISEFNPGEIVGEFALITEQDRIASILAIRDCELFRLSREVFTQIIEKYPQIMMNVFRSIIERLGRNTPGLVFRSKSPNIAVLPASGDVLIDTICGDLVAAMSEHGPVEHLRSHEVDQTLGQPGISHSDRNGASNVRLVQWLNSREAKHRYVLYQAEPEWPGWTERCVRQADHVIIVADSRGSHDSVTARARPAGPGQRWSLLLLHSVDTDRPRDTGRWLATTGTESVFHLRHDYDGDLRRLARILSGNAVGLVLGGGGARGFAHIGVLQALEELGVPVDMVGGASIGAPIAGWIAQGKRASECLSASLKAFHSVIDVTLPTTSLIAGKRVVRSLRNETASWDIEDYWLPFYCVSTSLTTARSVVHRLGNSVRAIRASLSIPGVLPPLPEGGELLVDGGVLNNLPINVMRELNPSGVVIAIDVQSPRGIEAKGDYGLSLSGWRQLLDRVLPWRQAARAPRLAVIVTQSMIVGSNQARDHMLQQELADLYLNIHVPGVGMLQFEAIEKAVRIGYENAIEPLRKWATSRE